MRTTKLHTLAAAMLIAFSPLAAHAQSTAPSTEIDTQTRLLDTTAQNKGQTQVATKIASNFTRLAGSEENALQLVRALRDGSKVTLTGTTTTTAPGSDRTGTGTTTTTSFTPPTGKMGWGNVFNSLALAQDSLARMGITSPTNAQLQAALVGGEVTGADGKVVTMKGILTMRADGMGWGQIAHASGTKLGPVVSSIKSTQNKVAALPADATTKPIATTNASASAKGNSSKGITTAAGTSAGPNAGAKGGSKGVVTAGGGSAGGVTHGNSGNSGGKGVVTAAGGSAGGVTHGNSGNAGGKGVVNAGGGNASGVSSAAGNTGGQGKGNGKGKGG